MKSNTYYFISPEIKVDNKTLLVNEEFYPVKNTESIYIIGEYKLNSQLLSLLNQENIILHFGNYYGHYMGAYYPYNNRYNNKLVLKQYETYTTNQKNQKFEKLISKEYVKVIKSMLRHYDNRGYIDLDKERLKRVGNLEGVKKFLDEALVKKFYFENIFSVLNEYGWEITEREYHKDKLNPINSLLSFYYSLIYKDTINSLYKQGFDPRISFVHAVNNRKNTSLEYDISDHYKVLLIDRLVIKLVMAQKVTRDMFTENGKIKSEHIRPLIAEYEAFMSKKYTYNIGKQTGKQVIDKQVAIYKKYMLDNEKFIGVKLI